MNDLSRLQRVLRTLGLLLCLLVSLAFGAPSATAQVATAEDSFSFRTFSTSVRFENDGTGVSVDEAEIEIKSRAASQQLGQLYFPYIRSSSRLEIDFVRVVKPDGSSVDTTPELIQDLPAPVAAAFPIYTDLRIVHVTVPPFEPGDTVAYRVSTHVEKALTPGHFSLIHSFDRAQSIREQTLRIDVPAGRTVSLRTAEEFAPEVADDGARKVYSWTLSAEDLPEQDLEKIVQGRWESDVELSSFESWEQVGDWFRDLSDGRAEPDRSIRKKVEELLSSLEADADAAERIAALHRLAAIEIRYLGLLLGDAAYQPRAAPAVLESGFGDCKDKHVLLAALLRAAGFEASPVLVSHQNATPLDVPTQLHFDHVITHVRLDDEDLWLDSTAIAPPGFLPRSLRGKQAVLVSAGGETRRVTLPEDLPFDQMVEFEATARIDASGTLRTDNVQRVRGDDEFIMRATMLSVSPEQWREAMKQSLSMGGFEGEIADLRTSDATDIGSPLSISFSMEEDAFLAGSGSVSGRLPFPRFDLPDLEETEEGRLDLSALQQLEHRLTLELPEGVEIEPPLDVEVDMELFVYRADYSFSAGRLEVVRRLRWHVDEIEAAELSRYEAFRRAVRKDVRQKVDFRLAQPIGEDDPEVLRRSARAAVSEEDWPRAADLARRLTAVSPDEVAGWEILGRALRKMDDEEGAVAARRRVVELDRFREGAHYNLGLVYEDVGDDESAIGAYREQLRVDPLHEKARARLGLLLARAGECEEAVPYLERVDEEIHAYDWMLRRLGACLVALDRRGEAAETFSKLTGRDDAGAIEDAAYDVMNREAWSEAIVLFRRLLELKPEHRMAHHSLGWSLQHAGEETAAEASYRRHMELHPASDVAVWNLANLLHPKRRFTDIAEILEQYLQHQPDDFKAWKYLGRVLFYDLKRLDGAREPMEKAYEMEPEDAKVNLVLGILESRAERFEAAARHLEVAKKGYPEPFEYQDLLDYCREQMPNSGG